MIGLMEKSRDEWPSWGRLIDDARDRLDPPVSQNEAARQLDMSGTNWRRIVQGISGAMASKRGATTVARMARLGGVSPRSLHEHGHPQAAEELRRLVSADDPLAQPYVRVGLKEELEAMLLDPAAARDLDLFVRMRKERERELEERQRDVG